MYDEPDEVPSEDAREPAERAREQADKFRMHAELAAVFEGPRKFDAAVLPGLDPDVARDVQRTVGKLGNAIANGGPVLTGAMAADAMAVLRRADVAGLSTGDYHVHRRPGEVMVVRWLAGEQVDVFYDRLQAHFDAGLAALKEDERQAHGWKQDPAAAAYLAALDAVEVKMPERFLRDVVRRRRGSAAVLSTTTADEINIAYLCDTVMGVPPAEVVGKRSAPPTDAEPSEQDLAWYFKLFSLRGMDAPGDAGAVERMCFFTYLQKADGDDW